MMRAHNEQGMTLLSTVMVMMLMSALLVGFVSLVVADQQAGGLNRDQTQVYATAHAGLEKLTADLGDLFVGGNYSPTRAQLDALEALPPTLDGFVYEAPGGGSGYRVTQGPTETDQIPSGPYQGLVGLITPYDVTVTARSRTGGETRMRRQMQTVGIPVFQFGIFSENDLAFFAGPNFDFGGRVHTNQNLFLKQDGGNTLTLRDRVTAVGEVIRTHLQNGVSGTHTSRVRITTVPGTSNFRNLGAVGCGAAGADPSCEGSLVGNVGSAWNETQWTTAVGQYNRTITNGRTGATRLDLPLVSDGAAPIDLIRRPDRNTPDVQRVLDQRYYSLASVRILLSDRQEDLIGGPGPALPNITPTPPISLDDAATVAGYAGAPFGRSSGAAPFLSAAGTPLVGGFIKIEKRTGPDQDDWQDVTLEILNLGVAGRNLSHGNASTARNHNTPGNACAEPYTNAVIRIERLRDVPVMNAPCGNGSTSSADYWPNTLYDTREALRRDKESATQNNVYLGGVMHYIELDVNNLRRWLAGDIAGNGTGTWQRTGYVVYFSDRRGNDDPGPDNVRGTVDDVGETGEYGWEDFVNTDTNSTPNGVRDPGEDVNGDGTLQRYGNVPKLPSSPLAPLNATANVYNVQVAWDRARANRPIFFRRALKLVNGARGNLPFPAGSLQGLTVVSENPVYVQGNYNADAAGFINHVPGTPDTHRSAGVMADAVTLLSNNWNDIRSFNIPHDIDANFPTNYPAGHPAAGVVHPLGGTRIHGAATTWYRLGIIAGKGLTFPRAGVSPTSGDNNDFGTDGGAHNFLRYIETWNGQTLNYRGSIVSFFVSRQGVGTYKCCDNVYEPPTRGYNFDVEFLNPSLLPPETPMFRDINTLTFRQLLRPTQ